MNTIRRIISLDGDWQFAYTKTSPEETNIFPKENQYETKLPVPAYWDDCRGILKYTQFWSREVKFNPDYRQIEFPMGGLKPPDASLPYILGTGWYKKIFRAETDWAEKRVVLHIGGAMLDAHVYLNGKLLKKYLSIGNPFDVVLDSALVYDGENELIIAVSNMRTDRVGCSIRGYKGKSAGINRSVRIEISDRARIEDCYIRANESMDKLIWSISVDRADDTYIKWKIKDENITAADGMFNIASEKICTETPAFNLITWSDRNPKLYTVELELVKGDKVIDSLSQSFGFRYAKSIGETIYLNDEPKLLRGLTDHAYFPETCTVTNDLSYYMRNIRILKDLGFNWTRFHTTIPPVEYLEAADRLGMLVQVETQNGFAEEDFVNMLMLCRKHPSVILYCCGNEVPIEAEFEKKLERMAELCHSLAPDCMYNPMEAMLRVECIFTQKEEGYTEDPVPHNALRLDKLREYSDAFGTAVWVYSYEALEPDIEKIDKRLSIYKKPCLVHEAGIFDTYLNLDLEKRYENTRIGSDLFSAVRKYMSKMGVLNNSSVYYRNSCEWMMQITKFMLEKARRCKAVSGYDFLGAIDCHWHRSGYAIGMLNEFYELKSASNPEKIRQYNGESVIISDISHKRNFFSGEKIGVELFASLYGGKDTENGELCWSFSDEIGMMYLTGKEGHYKIKNGGLCSLGKLSLDAPKVKGAGKHMKLKVRLSGGIYSLSNEWDFWIFPKANNICADNIRVLKELTISDVEELKNGAVLLLMNSEPFPSLPTGFQIASGGRVDGNTATVIYDHPITREFPHEGFCDWQFMPMLENGAAVMFNNLDIEFKPIIEVVSTYKMIRKQAALFELKVGNGRLIVCSLNMNMQDAATVKLYESIIKYASSDKFEPAVEMDAGQLKEIIESKENIDVDFSTDECFDDGGYAKITTD